MPDDEPAECGQPDASADRGSPRRVLSRFAAVAAVLLSSAAVLVLELASVRLAAPYVGMTFETYTASIGVALAAIAFGANQGGRAADAHRPERLVGPLLLVGGALVLVSRPIVLALGVPAQGTGPVGGVLLILAAAAAPIAVLSAVPPIVVKTQLRRLDSSGSVVGRFSALGTIGGLLGTFLTGFVLLATLPVSWVLGGTGGLLLLAGAWYALDAHVLTRTGAVLTTVTMLAGAGGMVLLPGPCDYQTAYYCMRVLPDDRGPTGRVLYQNDVPQSYVDLDDPRHLEFAYTQWFAAAIDAGAPSGPLHTLHVGGGGFTMPRWLDATRPGSTSLVLEVDPVVAQVGREQLGLRTDEDLRVRSDDARTATREQPANRYHVVLGDAFGGVSVPWHLTTREFATDVERTLRPGGLYVLNVIDNPPLKFLAAEIATLRSVFPEVAVIAQPDSLDGSTGGNFVIVAGDRLPDADAVEAAGAGHSHPLAVADRRQLARLSDGGQLLTDDYAPVDQLLTPYRYR